ncbi:hypothetical protein F5884DRAFT_871406 [Xylogone sp. PMI_703]|nr:hypothetical protein F5884DRAFT_871406 [Xylogone sp. PMI_703]
MDGKQSTLVSWYGSELDSISLRSSQQNHITNNSVPLNTLDNIAALELSIETQYSDTKNAGLDCQLSLGSSRSSTITRPPLKLFNPFSRLSQKFYKVDRKVTCKSDTLSSSGIVLDPGRGPENTPKFDRHHHDKSLSVSPSVPSSKFVTTMKSASMSLASFSIAQQSCRCGPNHSSTSYSQTPYFSENGIAGNNRVGLDPEVTMRLLQRRRVYVTLLVSMPALSPNIRSTINQNLNGIIELHDEILEELQLAIPRSKYTQSDYKEKDSTSQSNIRRRWRSVDVTADSTRQTCWPHQTPDIIAEPNVAAEVAQVFAKRVSRFFVYEEYGSKYELMIKDIASVYRTIPQWDMYQAGLEALAATLAPLRTQQGGCFKKSMTIGDLLVKPMQRVCKYPLLFAELLKHTPVCDCPDSHFVIQKTLTRLREAISEVNQAAADPQTKIRIEKSWLLQDRLIIPDEICTRSRDIIRSFGHARLCGVLYISWQTNSGFDGQHFICILYREYLVLASASKAVQVYTVQACIPLRTLKVEDCSNDTGKYKPSMFILRITMMTGFWLGLQCYSAPGTWKLVFEQDNQLFEIIMSACSSKEELEWRDRLSESSNKHISTKNVEIAFTALSLAIKPLGVVFGKPGTIARSLSMQQTTTTGGDSRCPAVIIKNPFTIKDPHSNICSSINRSHGRARSENLQASAQHIIRKLSVTSLASSFTKRSNGGTTARKPAEAQVNNSAGISFETSNGEKSPQTTTPHPTMECSPVSLFVMDQDSKKTQPSESTLEINPNMTSSAHQESTKQVPPSRFLKRWIKDKQGRTKPPLGNVNFNSIEQHKTPPVVSACDKRAEDKESGT